MKLDDGRKFQGTLGDDGKTFIGDFGKFTAPITIDGKMKVVDRSIIRKQPESDSAECRKIEALILNADDVEYRINQDIIREKTNNSKLPAVIDRDDHNYISDEVLSISKLERLLIKNQKYRDELRKKLSDQIAKEQEIENERANAEKEEQRKSLERMIAHKKQEEQMIAELKRQKENQDIEKQRKEKEEILLNKIKEKESYIRNKKSFIENHATNWEIIEQTQRTNGFIYAIIEKDVINTYITKGGDSMQGYVIRDLNGIFRTFVAVKRDRLSYVFNLDDLSTIGKSPCIAEVAIIPNGGVPTLNSCKVHFAIDE